MVQSSYSVRRKDRIQAEQNNEEFINPNYFEWLTSSETNIQRRNFNTFEEMEEAISLYFNVQSTKLNDIQKQFKEYLRKNELNYCCKAIY